MTRQIRDTKAECVRGILDVAQAVKEGDCEAYAIVIMTERGQRFEVFGGTGHWSTTLLGALHVLSTAMGDDLGKKDMTRMNTTILREVLDPEDEPPAVH